jgi:hypothetical protein
MKANPAPTSDALRKKDGSKKTEEEKHKELQEIIEFNLRERARAKQFWKEQRARKEYSRIAPFHY